MEIYISAIRAGGIGEIFVTFDICEQEKRSSTRFLLSDAQYIELSLALGASDERTYEKVERESKVYAAYKKAIYLLGFSSSSRKMLARKLSEKGFEAEFSAIALDRLEANGLLPEADYALCEAGKCLSKLWGAERIRAHLYEKGYSQDSVNSAFFALEDAGVDFDENCRALIDKKYRPLPSDKKEKQKIIASLMRYGYSLSQIKQAMKGSS